MEQSRSGSGNGQENVGIPDDLRCKRSDGKQWRCTAMSMPDKTVCEKHYVQAKRRAANSAIRATIKKAKRNVLGRNDMYLESKSDDFDTPVASTKLDHYHSSVSGRKSKERRYSSRQVQDSPETTPTRNFLTPARRSSDDTGLYKDSWRPYNIPSFAALEPSRSNKEYSGASSDSSEEFVGQTCHQCQRDDCERVIWCLRCNRKGYCDNCISTWYSDISAEETEKVCPACRGLCNCNVCLRADNTIKVRVREMPVLDKLQYLYRLLSAVLPVIQQIHHVQCSEVEIEKKLRGAEFDLLRATLNADEQMCCNICRIPIVDYSRRCSNCSFDLCLSCCQDLRAESSSDTNGQEVSTQNGGTIQDNGIDGRTAKVSKLKLKFSEKFPAWKSNNDGNISCPPNEYGGCGYESLNLSRIFKMNWVAKLVKNAEEMVSGCQVSDTRNPHSPNLNDSRFCQSAHREDSDDNFIYCPSSKVIKAEGIVNFSRHWAKGHPVIVKQVYDESSISSWDPEDIRRSILEISDEKPKDEDPFVKAAYCLDGSEVNIKLSHFMQGYKERRVHKNGLPELLKLKDWPSPTASEEFLFYQRPEIIRKLPFLEYIHSRFGVLNVSAKLPHYSLENDAGPRIYMSYGTYKELGRGDSVTNLHYNMRDMVYLLVHTCEAKLKAESTDLEHKKSSEEVKSNNFPSSPETKSDEGMLPGLSLGRPNVQNDTETKSGMNEDERIEVRGIEYSPIKENGRDVSHNTHAGVHWDVFRREDVPKLAKYLQVHWKILGKPEHLMNDFDTRSIYEGLFLNEFHKGKLKKEFGVEPWSFEQHPGEAIFIPAGCPFQSRNLQSNVQLAFDFLFPESVGESVRQSEEIRCLPNDHEAKLQVLEIGKISLYAASSAIKEVQKLVLDPKLGAELGYEDPNLTASVSEHLEKVLKRQQSSCA